MSRSFRAVDFLCSTVSPDRKAEPLSLHIVLFCLARHYLLLQSHQDGSPAVVAKPNACHAGACRFLIVTVSQWIDRFNIIRRFS